ncbi:hypothetical protein AaE_013360 [Aphanomyces astaci]|uniref:Integrase catalytic domain-containing protein n=1 Tax=Aphanomyces astaci TaxID=112090 RepID=A0A6A4ZKA4_APHAT|nr:hypothetical protein AaE_013360 [Aphanomyces astaci]
MLKVEVQSTSLFTQQITKVVEASGTSALRRVGPINIPSISGSRYFVTFIDDFTRYNFVYIMQKHSAFCRDARQRYHSPPSEFEEFQALQMDNAKEYVKLGVRIQSEYGTRLTYTNAYTPSQSPVVEQRTGIIVTMARSMLLHGNLPQFLWGEAISHAVFLVNIQPSTTISGDTPCRLWHQSHPDYARLRVFGSVASNTSTYPCV